MDGRIDGVSRGFIAFRGSCTAGHALNNGINVLLHVLGTLSRLSPNSRLPSCSVLALGTKTV
jgi:hypothetical protein